MKFCIIRLGKDSVSDIKNIDSANFTPIRVAVICKQVPIDVNGGTYCLVWLGSDNNKGVPTVWEQGLRAFGKVIAKSGGPGYNDDWQVDIEINFILRRSIKKPELLMANNAAYYWCSNVPIVGLNTSSNQTIQLIKQEEPRQDVAALFYCINSVDSEFYKYIEFHFPELEEYITFSPSDESDEIVEEESIDIETPLVNHAFNPLLVNIDNRLINIDLIVKRLNQNPPEIDLYPEFQRNDNLWNATEQSRLIESILIRFPLPAFYFDGSNPKKWLVVDGLQRLSSIRNFVLTKSLKLTNLEFLTQLNNHGYDDLDRDLQRIIEETQISAYIINPGTPEDVKFNIFKRINTGGLILESQEIRHALYQGKPSRFIADLADLQEFKKATGYSIKSQRMLDRDFVNRFVAFYLLGYSNYSPDLESYMSKAMAQINELTDNTLRDVKQAFIKSMILNNQIFDGNPFRKIDLNAPRRKPLNKALFDVFSVLFAQLDESESKILLTNRNNLLEEFIHILRYDTVFQSAISTSTSDKNRVLYRFNKIKDLLHEIITTNK
jgi:hypothetical protein